MLKAASAGTTAFAGRPNSCSALAKPKPWMSPKAKVTFQRPSMSREKKFSTATNTIEAAIAGSTMVLGMTTICSAASDSVIECASVNAVTILITGNSRRAHSTIAIRKAM